jgi:type II secretory pathway component GspD/PulD (secretin)
MHPIYQKCGWSILLPGHTAIIAVLLLSCGICAAYQDPPKHLRVSVQYIETTHSVLTEMLAGKEKGGAAVHAKAIALAKDGKAKILETCMVVCRSGQKATVESRREVIYPTEYQPPGSDMPIPNMNPHLRNYYAFETRNTGVTFEIEPTLGANDQIIDLRFVPEIISVLRFDTWMEHTDEWGDASLRMPVFETWRVNTSVTLRAGQSEMVSVITPKSVTPAVSRKLLVFVRADVITP